MSEAGAWLPGQISSPRTNVQTDGAHAFGTMVSFDGTNYIDSVAVLQRPMPAAQWVQATLANNSAPSGVEAELVLWGILTSSWNSGYEIDLVYSSSSMYLVRWNGPPNNFTILQSALTTNVSLANGAIWYAEISAAKLITVKCNGNVVTTYDASADTIQPGSPGMGFWNETGSAANQTKVGWTNWSCGPL